MSLPATPALDRWRDEMARGLRQLADRDALARAASEEATALEAAANGCQQTAARAIATARELWPGDGEDPLDLLEPDTGDSARSETSPILARARRLGSHYDGAWRR